jgi:putative Holliday junction resolvase
MTRLLAIDYGLKRTGLAHTDDEQLIASALETIETRYLIEYLKKYLAKYNVETIIIGYPTHLNGQDTNATPLVRAFIDQLKQNFKNIKIDLENEHFTSKIALKTIESMGVKVKQYNKQLLDKVSATIILQSYLSKHQK